MITPPRRILIGGIALLALAVTLYAAPPREYSFDHGTTLEPGFTQQITASPVIEFGGVGYTATGLAAAFDANNTYANDQCAWVTLGPDVSNSGPTVRAKQQDAARDYVWWEIFSGQYSKVWKVIDGTSTQVGSLFDGGSGSYYATGQKVTLVATGTTYTFFKNGVAAADVSVSIADATLATGSAGFATASGGGGLADWHGADGDCTVIASPLHGGQILHGVGALFLVPLGR